MLGQSSVHQMTPGSSYGLQTSQVNAWGYEHQGEGSKLLNTLMPNSVSSFPLGLYFLCFSCGIAATHRPCRYHGAPQLLQPALSEHPPFYQSYSCRSYPPPATAAQWLCASAGPNLWAWTDFHSKVPKVVVNWEGTLRYKQASDLGNPILEVIDGPELWEPRGIVILSHNHYHKQLELEWTLETSSLPFTTLSLP